MASRSGNQQQRNRHRQYQRKQQAKRSSKKRSYNPFKQLTRNQSEVARRLIDGEVTMLSHAGWGFVERFLVFLHELGIYELLKVDGHRFYRQMFNLSLLLITYEIKVLLGISSMNQLGTRLFKDLALLRLIGYTADQLASGFCRRGKQDSQKPLHKNTLADAVEKLTHQELEQIFNGAIQRLAARGVFTSSNGVFALDSSDLETTTKYQGRGCRTKQEKHFSKGKIVTIERITYGFKVFALYEVQKRIVVALRVRPIHEHDSNYTLELVEQAKKNLGVGVLKVLLIDRGFLDGETLWTLKNELRIDFVLPAKRNMCVTQDARALAYEKPDGAYIFTAQRLPDTIKGICGVTLTGLKGLISYERYGDAAHQKTKNRKDFVANPINTIVITSFKGVVPEVGKERVFLTSLGVSDPLVIFDHYDLRSLIENRLFRELKQGWCLTSFPKKSFAAVRFDAVRAHVVLSVLMFNLTNSYRTQLGQDITQRGIRCQRLAWHTPNKVMIFAGGYYGIFDLEEILILLGSTPEICWRVDPREVKRRYRWPPSDASATLPMAA